MRAFLYTIAFTASSSLYKTKYKKKRGGQFLDRPAHIIIVWSLTLKVIKDPKRLLVDADCFLHVGFISYFCTRFRSAVEGR